MGRRRRVGRGLALAGLALVAVATLTPASDPRHLELSTPLWCLVCGDEGGADVVANLLLFLPLAIGLRLSGWSWRRTVANRGRHLVHRRTAAAHRHPRPGCQPERRPHQYDQRRHRRHAGAVFSARSSPTPPQARRAAGRRCRRLARGPLASPHGCSRPGSPPGGQRVAGRTRFARPDVSTAGCAPSALMACPCLRRGPPPGSAALRHRLEGGTFSLEAEVLSGDPVGSRSFDIPARSAVPAARSRCIRTAARPGSWCPPGRSGSAPARGAHPRRTDCRRPRACRCGYRATGRGRQLRLTSRYGGRGALGRAGVSPAYGWIMLAPFESGRGHPAPLDYRVCLARARCCRSDTGRRRTGRGRPPLGCWPRRSWPAWPCSRRRRPPAGPLVGVGGRGARRRGRLGPPAARGLS